MALAPPTPSPLPLPFCHSLPVCLQVTVGFQTTNMLTALPTSFLDPLLSFTLMEDAEVRLLVLDILISIIDRHDNRLKFSSVRLGYKHKDRKSKQTVKQIHVNYHLKNRKHIYMIYRAEEREVVTQLYSCIHSISLRNMNIIMESIRQLYYTASVDLGLYKHVYIIS